MKFIYVQNYLTTSRDTKLEFFAHCAKQTQFRVVNQKIILNDNSMILELDDNSNIPFAKEYIEEFFKNYEKINIKIVNEIIQNNSKIVLDFESFQTKEVLL